MVEFRRRGVIRFLGTDVTRIRRNRAHLLYKQEGYEKVFDRLDRIITGSSLPKVSGL